MPLDLTTSIEDEITFKNPTNGEMVKFILTADIPRCVMSTHKNIAEGSDDIDETWDNISSFVIDVLALRNERKAVERFVENQGFANLLKISNFINQFITECAKAPEYEEKKTK